jgi:hypothetical protein
MSAHLIGLHLGDQEYAVTLTSNRVVDQFLGTAVAALRTGLLLGMTLIDTSGARSGLLASRAGKTSGSCWRRSVASTGAGRTVKLPDGTVVAATSIEWHSAISILSFWHFTLTIR